MNEEKDTHKYDYIINLPHHRSVKHPQMSLYDRAAQFAPFSALTGHDAAIQETARLTDKRIELDEDTKNSISNKMNFILENITDYPEVSITYFVADKTKSGGKYISVMGLIRKIDDYERIVIMKDKTVIPIDDILSIDGEMLNFIH